MPRASHPKLVPLPGSTIPPLKGARRERAAPSRRRLTLTIRLRSRSSAKSTVLVRMLAAIIAGKRPPLTRQAFDAVFGAARADVARVRRFARARGFTVGRVRMPERVLHLTGRKDALARAFGVDCVTYRIGTTSWDSYTGSLHLPMMLKGCVTGVFGFDDRPQAARGAAADATAAVAAKRQRSYTPTEVASLYSFPRDLDGRGQSIGVIALGGGYLDSDLRTFFRRLHLPHPKVTAVSVAGARNAPHGRSAGFDGEVTGDVETIGALAPRAKIAVYFAPNTARGFLEAISTAVHDRQRHVSVLSISWGQAEVHWTRRTLRVLNEVLLEAAVLGITVCCASGDHGSFADAFDRLPHVCFPASSPYVLACGGTTLIAADGRVRSESVWHNQTGASGGGVSEIFVQPWWQRHSRVPKTKNGRRGRGVPDVASNADPRTGYRIFGHGHWAVGAGTSASAPLWAGLVARINQRLGAPVGLLTPFLYQEYDALVRFGALRRITKGNNGAYRARRGWNCCTGVGVPHGTKLTVARHSHQAAPARRSR